MNDKIAALVAELREAITDWGDNMRNETMADLLARTDRIEAALSSRAAVEQGGAKRHDVAWVGKTDAGLRLASMLRDDVRLGDFQSAVVEIVAAAPAPQGE
jgi:hypothetical protein